MIRIEIYQDRAGKYRFRFCDATTNQILLYSLSYTTEEEVHAVVEEVKDNGGRKELYQKRRKKFKLKTSQSLTIAIVNGEEQLAIILEYYAASNGDLTQLFV